MVGKLRSITYYLVIGLIGFIPFQTFLTEFLIQRGLSVGLTYYLMHWYEPVVVVSLVIWLLLPKVRNNIWKEPATYLIALGMISALYLTPNWQQGVQGFRMTLFALVIYLLIKLSEIKLTNTVIKLYLVISIAIAGWGIVEQFLPHLYWSLWHILPADSIFGFGRHAVSNIYQSTSLLPGPNQLAGYLLPAFFISLANPLKWKKLWQTLSVIVISLALLLTFSRSALIGLVIGSIIYVYLYTKNRRQSLTMLGISAFVLLVIAVALFELGGTSWREIFLHTASQSGHIVGPQATWQILRERLTQPIALLFGGGLGTAGPLALKFGGVISESWYLQLALELGITGLVLWCGTVFLWLKQLFLQAKGLKAAQGIFLGLIAVSVMALFLHPWADNPALAITLMVLIAPSLKPAYN